MGNNERKLKLKKLDALYIMHNPLDCLIVYFCICFTFIRTAQDALGLEASVLSAYAIAALVMACLGMVMRIWAKRTFQELGLHNIL